MDRITARVYHPDYGWVAATWLQSETGHWGWADAGKVFLDPPPRSVSSLTSDEWQVVKDLWDEMVRLRDLCQEQHEFMSCCNDPDAECPIAMGEWWGDEQEKKMKQASDLLFPKKYRKD